ncbi:MAG: hypothetical protein E4H00_09705 [Myxococcales bacterium]|nr:MAG: hypothetical protein E4H00_09705 [Myxococcales bacterium]
MNSVVVGPINWIAVGAIAEAIGVVGVLVSLVYVAIQIRQNTQLISRSVQSAQLAAFERNIESGNGIRELMILHPALAELFLKGLKSYGGLDASEKFRFGMLLRNTFSSTQGAYIRELTVRHDPQGSEGPGGVIDSILVNPGAREWLQQIEPDWRPEFRDFVASRLLAIEQKTGESPA